jgi:hypothetical protein
MGKMTNLNMKSFSLSSMILIALAITLGHAGDVKYAVIPVDGFVPDKATAMKIAEAVWVPIYGQKVINSEKPFKAQLKDGVWMVEGTLPTGDEGGVALAEIAKSDGRIIRVTHGQ